jgi:hypothetical protein
MEITRLLDQETVLPLCTLLQVWSHLEIPSNATANVIRDQRLRAMILSNSRVAMTDPEIGMLRAIQRKARLLEIHDVRPNQREFHLLAAPIITTVAPVVRVNYDDPRVWTDADDVVDSEDVLCSALRAQSGIVRVENYFPRPLAEAVAFDYTGGMGTWTGWTGWDGSTSTSGGVFNGVSFSSASGDFIAAGVAIGFKLVIESGTCAGTYEITSLTKTELRVIPAGSFTAAETGLPFHVTDADGHSLIQDYPDLAEAMAAQTANDYRMRGKENFTSESAGGASVSWSIPAQWLNRTRDTLARYRLRGA